MSADAPTAESTPAPLSEEEYKSLVIAQPKGTDEWNRAVNSIKAVRDGLYPSDWFARIVCDKQKFPILSLTVTSM